jgi:hypothetical protein
MEFWFRKNVEIIVLQILSYKLKEDLMLLTHRSGNQKCASREISLNQFPSQTVQKVVDYIVKHGEKEVRKGGKGTPGLSDEELTVFDENFVNVDLGTLKNLTLVHSASKP